MGEDITLRLHELFPWQAQLRRLVFESPARFIVGVMGRRAGKTTICAELCGEVALAKKGKVFWGAPTHDLAGIGREIFLKTFRSVVTRSIQTPQPMAELLGEGQALWRSFDRGGSAIGRGYDIAIVDEAARVSSQTLYEDLFATVADTGGKIVAITTPRGQRNWVHEWYTKAVNGEEEFAAVHGPSTENPSPLVQEFVRIAKQNMPDHYYRQEILGQFIEGEGAVFRNIRECATLKEWKFAPTDPNANYVVGADVAKHQDYTVLYAMNIETGAVEGMDRFQHLDWPFVEQRIKEFSTRWNNAMVWLDATGVGDPVYDALCYAHVPVEPIKFNNTIKSQMVLGLVNALAGREVAFPEDEVLIAELEIYSYEAIASGFRYEAPDGYHDDCVTALMLATYGWQHAFIPSRQEMGWIA